MSFSLLARSRGRQCNPAGHRDGRRFTRAGACRCLTEPRAGHRLPAMGRRARPLVLLLLACLVSLTPLAYASPPDPTWTDGFYDDDDGDDVVVSLSWAAWAVGAPPPAADAP